MPATALVLTAPSRDGVAPPAEVDSDAVNGNSFPNNPGVSVLLRNADAAARNVTFKTPTTVDGFAVADHVVSIPAGATRAFGRFPRAAFGKTVEFTTGSTLIKIVAAYTA